MSKYIKDFDDQEFINIVEKLNAQHHFIDKALYSYETTGIQCLLPDDFSTRTIGGKTYVWGFEISSKFEHTYVLNLIAPHLLQTYFSSQSGSFMERINRLSGETWPERFTDIINTELEVIADNLKNREEGFKVGYTRRKAGKRHIIPTFDDERRLNITECWSYSMGAASYDFELFLKKARKDSTSPPKLDTHEPIELIEPAFILDTQYEMLLYIKYSGIYEHLEKALNQNKTAIGKAIAQMTKIPAASIRPLLSALAADYSEKNPGKNLYNKKYVENTLNALRDAGFDTTKLNEVYMKMSKK